MSEIPSNQCLTCDFQCICISYKGNWTDIRCRQTHLCISVVHETMSNTSKKKGLYLLQHISLKDTYAVPYVGAVPDVQNIHNILKTIAHRVGQQSGLDESSGRKSTIFPHGIAFRIYLTFSKIGKNIDYSQLSTYTYFFWKRHVVQKHMWQAWNAVSGAWGYQSIQRWYNKCVICHLY